MITITRRIARQVRAVFRRALGLTRGFGPAVSFRTGPDGLRIGARQGDLAAEYHAPGDHEPQELVVPFEFLADCEGGKNEPVQLEGDGKSHIVANWHDGKIPQLVRYDTGDMDGDLPALPANMLANGPRLLTALHDAADVTADYAGRYGINCIQLQGKDATIAATDGRQLLVQSGFAFPFDDDVLIRRTKVFGSREFARIDDVSIGNSDKTIVVRIGPWTIWCPIEKDTHFPAFRDLVPQPSDATTVLELAETDADSLVKSLKRLPCNDDLSQPITVDLNGQIMIRASADDQTVPTELVLSNSTMEGTAICINTNRAFLARAVKLGFRRICLRGEAPAACFDQHRSFVWALLGKEDSVKPSDKTVRTESPSTQVPPTPSTNSKEQASTMPTNRIKANSNGEPKQNGAAETVGVDSLIEQAEAVKASLREATAHVSQLVTSLKRHRKQAKSVQIALASLRELPDVRV